MLRLLLALSLCVSALLAQTETGAIRVLVTDATESPVLEAAVQLTNSATGVTMNRLTANDGYATFTPVPSGDYTVEVTRPKFQSYRVTDVRLGVSEHKLVRATLAVSEVTETIEVSAQAEVTQTEQGSLGQVVGGNVAVMLPLAARRYSDLALLVPGVAESTMPTDTRGPGWFVVNGNHHTQNNFILEGIDNNQGTINAQTLSAQAVQPSPDAIGEFKVQTNSFSAEFGRSAGAVVNVVLKSGANEIHGSGWEYNRSAALAATPWSANVIGAPKPDLRWNQFGGTIGGAIQKNRLFYFMDYEGFLQRFSNQFITTVPSVAARGGVFYRDVVDPDTKTPFPGRTIPASRFDELGMKLVDLFPLPNQPGQVNNSGQNTNNYGVSRPGRENTHKGDVKGDYHLSEKDNFSARYSYLRQDIYREAIFEGLGDGVGNQGAQFNTNHSVGGTWTRVISPRLINVFRFGYTSSYGEFVHNTVDGPGVKAFGFKGIPEEAILAGNGGLPNIRTRNYSQLGTRGYRPQFQQPCLFQFMDNVSIVHGKHSLRTGFETRRKNNTFVNSLWTSALFQFDGRFTGESLADLMVGYPYEFQANTQAIIEQLQKAYAGYIQDDWKVLPNLTLNMGLRYEYTTPLHGKAPNRNVNFDDKTGKLVFAKKDSDYLVSSDYANWGPRIGVAWQIRPQRVVMRAGYGIFYSGEDIYAQDVYMTENPPQMIPVTLQQVGGGPPPFKLSAPVPAGIFDMDNLQTNRITVRAFDPDYRTPRIQQYNVALQFRLPSQSSFEAAYVGNLGERLFTYYSLNQTEFGVDGSVAANRPYPQWAQINRGASRGKSHYNGLQLKYEKRFSGGWYTLASYSYASALDEQGAWPAPSVPQFRDDFRSERGPHDQMPRQRFTWANVFQIPVGRGHKFGAGWNRAVDAVLGGWQISHILNTRTGLPINVLLASSGVDRATNKNYRFFSRNGGSLRPNRVGEPNTGIAPGTDRFHFLDAAAFAVQPVNTPGNSSRNVARGPKSFTVNLSLAKRFRVLERASIDLRLEAFNAFNNVNFGNPGANFGASNFGVITTAGEPRVVQTAVRFEF